ncbi:hypothetical protein HG536_0G03610 [Torulaspora globosa]|uniref:asparagine--tRNA ligase n=1 Tax=Torulaspora globosa TaxID=48254 RepID=A0A7G3ZLW3_9SACH|nr:uncharacterized protein HG536_0G03610 [Torulaspora globosa]QLL34499.1 hypothetical protein HG536_0G03610 [Torulaspora globosa]
MVMVPFKHIVRNYGTVQQCVLPITIRDLYKRTANPPRTVKNVNGWIRSVRLLKKMAFLDIQDGSCLHTLKVAIPIKKMDETAFLKGMKTGQSISIACAQWQDTPQREQPFELKIEDPLESISIRGTVTHDYPLQKKNHSLLFLRSLPTLKHRTTYLGSLMRFRSFAEQRLMNILQSDDFTKVSPPVLTSSDCEGAGELFEVKTASSKNYFGKPSYLTVSTQLHLEILAMSLSRCYTLTPCFRAERSDTNRHLSEFWMLELEMCFINDVRLLTMVVESVLRRLIESCCERSSELIPEITLQECLSKEEVLNRWNMLLNPEPWKVITYTEAIDILSDKHRMAPFEKYEPKWGEPLQTEHEKWLAGVHFQSPVFITDYPRDCKAFYMKTNTSASPGRETVACFDLLFPEMGEIAGGSIREDNYNELAQEMRRRGMNSSGELDWYLSLRLEGSVPHGGFGLGMERLISYLFGNHNIRDAIAFHRSATGTIDL